MVLKSYKYGGYEVDSEKYYRFNILAEDIEASLKGEPVVLLSKHLGLCDHLCSMAFFSWLTDKFGVDGRHTPINLSDELLLEDLELECNKRLQGKLKYSRGGWYRLKDECQNIVDEVTGTRVVVQRVWVEMDKLSGSVQFTHFAKYQGNMGKARLALLREFISALEEN